MRKRPVYEVGQWMWVYTLSTATGQKSLDKEAIEEYAKTKLPNKWTESLKTLGVGP